MLPTGIADFHIAFYGLATVAATLGYACARRAAISLASPARADVEAGPPEERSLKRKLDDSDENEVDTEEQSRPMKRNRTPPTDLHESDEDFNQEWEVVVAPPPYEEAVGLRPPELVQDKVVVHVLTTEQTVTPVREPTPPPHTEPASQQEEKGVETGRCPTPPPPQVGAPPDRPITPPKPISPAKIGSANAFSAFSGSGSPFASYSNASGASPFAISAKSAKTAPVWRRNNDNDGESDVFGQASPVNTLALSPNDVLSSAATESSAIKSALGVCSETPSLGQSSNYLTGEEDESVEAELKGVKLFIKRGRKEFTDGMYGHIKLLAQKSAPQKVDNEDSQDSEADTNSRTRLLFRRDPLGQVSMNVGLHPTVRCHFDAAENILRIILMEQVTADGKTSEDVVVYALKPGRVQKADFQHFSKTLCDHEGLQSKMASNSGNSDDATAP